MKRLLLLGVLALASSARGAEADKAAVTVRVAKFAGDRAAAISYTFDDGLRDQYTLAAPMLNEVGFRGSFFVIPGHMAATAEAAEEKRKAKRGWGGITWAELRELAAQGHEIGNHTWSHRSLPKLAPEEVELEFDKAAEVIKAEIGRAPQAVAFPFNHSTPETEAVALKRHLAFREYQTGFGGDKATPEWLSHWVDKQVRERAWGVAMIHGVGEGYAAFTDPEIFRAHLREVKGREAEIWVAPFGEVARYVKAREAAKLTVLAFEPGGITCTLLSGADTETAGTALTLVLEQAGAAVARATRAGEELPVHILADAVLIEAAPAPDPVVIRWR